MQQGGYGMCQSPAGSVLLHPFFVGCIFCWQSMEVGAEPSAPSRQSCLLGTAKGAIPLGEFFEGRFAAIPLHPACSSSPLLWINKHFVLASARSCQPVCKLLSFLLSGDIRNLLQWIKENLLKERPELFMQGESV